MKVIKSKTTNNLVRVRNFFVLSQVETREFMKLNEMESMVAYRNNAVYTITAFKDIEGYLYPSITNYELKAGNKLQARFVGVINGRVVQSEGEGDLKTLNNKECKALANGEVVNYNKNGVNYDIEYTFESGLIAIHTGDKDSVIEFDDVLLQTEVSTSNF